MHLDLPGSSCAVADEQNNLTPERPMKEKFSFLSLPAAVPNASARTLMLPPPKPFTLQWDVRPAAQGVLYYDSKPQSGGRSLQLSCEGWRAVAHHLQFADHCAA